MKESIGYTVTLNIVIVFIIIVFAFLSAAFVYFKSNKVSNVITETIEKYEGYNDYAKNEINIRLTNLGYDKKNVDCQKYFDNIGYKEIGNCRILDEVNAGIDGYCVFQCRDSIDDEWYYYYKISTNLMLNIPIINSLLDVPIFSNTNRLYDFACQEADLIDCK